MSEVILTKPCTKEEEELAQFHIESSRIHLIVSFPFYGQLALSLKTVMSYNCPTMATDGKDLIFNPRFVLHLSKEAVNFSCLNFVNVHEVLHAALGHLWRRGHRDAERWNVACDFAINSMITEHIEKDSANMASYFQLPAGALLNKDFNGLSADEIYDKLPSDKKQLSEFCKQNSGGGNPFDTGVYTIDCHDYWDKEETQQNSESKQADWEGRLINAAKEAMSRHPGSIPGYLERLVGRLLKPQKDWRLLLAEFVEYYFADYGFNPPDRRFANSDFILPDFSEVAEQVKKILFLVDTSGSITDDILLKVYGEILGAIQQFDKLEGYLGFFDHAVYEPQKFEGIDDVLKIRPVGGGGTDFHKPLSYAKEHMDLDEVAGIVMLTDGFADFPTNENITGGIPVIWLITNEEVTPPWGLHAVLKI